MQVDEDESYIANDIVVHNCAPIPKAISYASLGLTGFPDPPPIQTGEAWFREQPETTQLAMMGPGKLEAWQAGKFEFVELSTAYQDEVYGELLRETTLKELAK